MRTADTSDKIEEEEAGAKASLDGNRTILRQYYIANLSQYSAVAI